jgi:hypothetical protein
LEDDRASGFRASGIALVLRVRSWLEPLSVLLLILLLLAGGAVVAAVAALLAF